MNASNLFKKIIFQEIDKQSQKRILDIGCGDAKLLDDLSENNFCLGIDLVVPYNLNLPILKGDFLDVELNSKFDLIYSVFTFHHMNLELALKKSLSLLANNGRIVIIDILSSRKTNLLSYLIEQIVFECLSLNKIFNTIKAISLVNTLRLFQYRVNFFTKGTYRKHIYEDLGKNLPPEKQVWEKIVQSVTKKGCFKIDLSYLSTKVIVIKILKL